MENMQVTMKTEFRFEVGHCREFITFKGAFEKDLIQVLSTNMTITSDDGHVLDDEQLKEQIINAILYGLKERG